jgi:hypothetical protein
MLSTIEEMGEDKLLLTFLRHYWISVHGPTISDELGARIETTVKSERQAVDLIISLEASADDYVALLTPREHPKWAELGRDGRDCLHTITRELQAVQIRPLLLSIGKNFEKKEAIKAFNLCLSWTVRFLIAGGGGGGFLDRHYGLRAMEVSRREVTTAKKLAERMSEVVPNDAVFRAAFAIASVRQGHLARYYLKAIDLYLKGEPKPQLLPSEDTTALNLEHVLPVTPSANWDISADVAAAYYRRLGNMALLGAADNVRLGNKPFTEKKKTYKGSPFILTDELSGFKKWGPEEISKHQQRMAEVAPKIWSI